MRLLFALFWLLIPGSVLADPETPPQLLLVSQRVSEVSFEGDPLPEAARAKFSSLAGRDFSASAVRAAILWSHENGIDSLIQVRATHVPNGIALRISSHRKIRISALTFSGNSTVTGNVLAQQIDLKEDMEFEAELARQAVQKINLFYSKQGYLAADVGYFFDPQKRVLKFQIREGDPTLISGISISEISSVERKDLKSRYEKEIMDAFALRVGDRIQRDRVLDGVQAIKDWLRDHDFLLARDPVLEYKVAEDGKVGIFINISYGPRIRYGFRGNTRFSYRELMLLVSDVKEVASGTDYLTSVRRKVLEAYKEIGFANAKITTLVREDPTRGIRYVSLIVSEGSKILIDGISIEGVYSMDKSAAVKELKGLGSRLVQRDYFDESGLNHAAELFAEKLRSRGFLSAKLEYIKHEFNQDRSKVKATILFNEGLQTKVEKVEIVGVKSFPVSEVLETFGLKEGEPFNIFAFERGLQVLKEKYQDIGNLSAQIVNEASDSIVRYNQDNTGVSLRVEVDEGPAYRVGEIVVRGNKLTHARVVLRELPFISGDLLTGPHLQEAEENLRKLNLFSDVKIRPIDHPSADDIKDILILVDESEPGTFDIVPGIRNDLGARLGFEFGYQNIGGWNRSVNASAVFNRRLQDYYGWNNNNFKRVEYKFSVGFKEPYLAEWPVVFSSSLDFLRRQYKSFDANVRKFTSGIKRELRRFMWGFVEYGYEQIEIYNARAPYDPSKDNRIDFIGSLTPGFIIDTRKDIFSRPNSFNPVKGFYSVDRFEVASRAFGSKENVAYYRATSYNSTYFRFFEDWVLALAVNLGWERSNAIQGLDVNGNPIGAPIPTLKLFRLGGLGSIRGYEEDAIEVETQKVINGSLGLINYRGELRIPIQGNLGTAFFIDAGNLMVDRFSFAPDKLRSSIGTGLRYGTPVGPVLLDIAWRLQNDPGVGDTCVTAQSANARDCDQRPTDRYKIHFAIGVF